MLKYIFKYLIYYAKKFWFIIAIAVIAIIFTIFARQQDLLNVYTGGDSTYTVEETEEEETEVAMTEFASDELALTLQVPEGWEHVTQDGYDTFIHSPSATSIQLQIMSYYPQINNVSMESLSEDLLAVGYSLTDFSWTGLNSYLATYQSETSAGIMDYIDFTIWDLSHVVKLHVTVQDENYERIKDPLLASLDSLVWDYEDPIPENVVVNYFMNGDFQFGIPYGWTTGEQDGSLYAYDEASGTSMSVSYLEDQDPDIDSITQLDYATFAGSGKTNFILSLFEKGQHYIYGEATYSVNNTMMGMMQYYGIYGTTHYIITFEIPYDLVSDYYDLCRSCISIFRTFGTPSDESGEEISQEESIGSGSTGMQEDLNLDGLLGDVPISSSPQEEATEAQGNTESPGTGAQADTSAQSETSQEDPAAQEGSEESVNVSSFADALVAAIGIPTDKAIEISTVWDSLAVGTPTYAQAIKESDTSYVLYILAEGSLEYYMTVGKDGTLQSIHVGSEDGQVLYQSAG